MMETGYLHAGMIVTFDGGTLTITGFDSTMRDGEAWSSDECEPPCVVPIIANCLNACPSANSIQTVTTEEGTCAVNCVMACASLAGANADAIAACSDVLGSWEDGEDVAVSVCMINIFCPSPFFFLFPFFFPRSIPYIGLSSCGTHADQNLLL